MYIWYIPYIFASIKQMITKMKNKESKQQQQSAAAPAVAATTKHRSYADLMPVTVPVAMVDLTTGQTLTAGNNGPRLLVDWYFND